MSTFPFSNCDEPLQPRLPLVCVCKCVSAQWQEWSASQAVTSCGLQRHRLFVTWATPIL